ncbi:MAG: hypothetical protein KAS12_00250, partial [Candidatus Aenigmarchaeota archaeon]|nr:hypothetical protein [Candidatus Aenigmarchaeota archaeon]
DGSNYYSDDTFSNKTNSTGYAHLNFNPTCLNDYAGAPKYLTGSQKWKIDINSTESTCYQQNDSDDTYTTTLSVFGNIYPTLTKPKLHSDTGGTNFTQEDNIDFLGYTTDDCGDSLTLNITSSSNEIKFYINQSAVGYNCTQGVDLVGSNAYSCTLPTSINTNKGWYNATIYVNKTNYYANNTLAFGDAGLFFMNPIKKLETPNGTPASEGWGYQNWNFSVIASSGDPDNTYNLSVMLSQTPPPTQSDKCEAPTCINQTITDCVYPDCVDKITYWYRNFTASDVGTWYYRYLLKYQTDEEYSTFDAGIHKIILEKDDNNITYTSGNNSDANTTDGATFKVRVFDFDANTYNLSQAANVTFHVNTSGYDKVVGSNFTNQSGYSEFYFVPTCQFNSESQNWYAEIITANQYYKENISDIYNVDVSLTGCDPSIEAETIYTPSEVFQYTNFTVSAVIRAWVSDAD